MNTATCIRQIAVVVVNCDFAGLRLHFRGHKHRPYDYQKRQQPNKFFHGFHRGKCFRKGCRMATRIWRQITERSVSSPDESPKERSPACIATVVLLLRCMAYVSHRFRNKCNDRRLTELQHLRRGSVKGKACGSSTKNFCANLTPLRLC